MGLVTVFVVVPHSSPLRNRYFFNSRVVHLTLFDFCFLQASFSCNVRDPALFFCRSLSFSCDRELFFSFNSPSLLFSKYNVRERCSVCDVLSVLHPQFVLQKV
jgi:hypothetical protein